MTFDSNRKSRSFKVTPWETHGSIQYEKLMKEFGTLPITGTIRHKLLQLAGEVHFTVERGVFYSHRDLDQLLEEYQKGKKFFVYTGRGPSGPMHIGHIVQFYFASWLQRKFDANVYIPLTDDEKFLQERTSLSLEEAHDWANENALDIMAAGFDPDKTFIFLDTEYIGHMYNLALRVAKRVNFSTAKSVFGFTNNTNIGFIFYPTLQIVPTFFEKSRCLIPSAIDQDPFWRIQRDIAEPLGYQKAAAIYSKFLPALTGVSRKMSTSEPQTAVYLGDEPKSVKEKIWKYAYSGGQPTLREHRRRGGNPDIDVAYQWLYMFFEPDDRKLRRIREEYVSGRLLSGELKEMLIKKVNSFLTRHRDARERAEDRVHLFRRDGKLASRMWEEVI